MGQRCCPCVPGGNSSWQRHLLRLLAGPDGDIWSGVVAGVLLHFAACKDSIGREGSELVGVAAPEV